MSECLEPNPCATAIEKSTPSATAEPLPVVRPRHTVRAVEGAYEVGVLMPGVRREAVGVRLEEGVLHVEGRREDSVPAGWKPLRREIGPLRYRLALEVTVPVDGAKISARLEDGVLSLRLPLREEAKARDIPVA